MNEEKNSPVFPLRETERLLRSLRNLAQCACFCAAAWLSALIFLSVALCTAAVSGPRVLLYYVLLCAAGCAALSVGPFLFVLVHRDLCRNLFSKREKTFRVTPQGLTYADFQRSRYAHPVRFLACALTATAVCAAVPFFMHSRWNFFRDPLLLCIEILIFAAALWRIGGFFLQKRMYASIRIVSGGDVVFETYSRKRERYKAIVLSVVYWMLFLAVYVVGSVIMLSWSLYLPLLGIGAVLFVLLLIANNPFRQYAGLRAKRISVRFTKTAAVVAFAVLIGYLLQIGSWYNVSYILSRDYPPPARRCRITYDPQTGVYTLIAKTDEFKILQLTDLHLCGSFTTIQKDRLAMDACIELVRKADPDLIILTGDVIFPVPAQSYSLNNLVPFVQLCYLMNKIGVPWTVVFGNHDTEPGSLYDAEQLREVMSYQKWEPGYEAVDFTPMQTLLYADVQPNCYGRYQQVIRLCNADGELQRLLFCMDSNDYINGNPLHYDYIRGDQIVWYRQTVEAASAEAGHTVPSFAFFHIPLPEYAEAYQALQNGSPDAVYLFGANEEAVSSSAHNSGLFDVMRELGSTQAVFVGHDHLNNMGIRYKGIDLVYSKSIDYIAYPGIADRSSQRGGTLITVYADNHYTIEQLHYDK